MSVLEGVEKKQPMEGTLKAGDKVIVLRGAWKWMKSYGWDVVSKNQSFTIDGKTGVIVSVGRHFCEVELEGMVNIVDVPKKFISPVGRAKNSKESSACNKTDDNGVLLRAIEHYGAKNQAGQLMGEMGELAAAVTQHFFQSRDRKKEIAEEIADVQIMIEQIILHLDMEDDVAKWRLSKLKRLESRMNQAG